MLDREAVNQDIAAEQIESHKKEETNPKLLNELTIESRAVSAVSKVRVSSGAPKGRIPVWVALATSLLLCSVSLGMYWFAWGDPQAIHLASIDIEVVEHMDSSGLESLALQLENRLEGRSEEQRSWFLLMRLYWDLQRYERLGVIHQRAEALGYTDGLSDQWFLLGHSFLQKSLQLPEIDRALTRITQSGEPLPVLLEFMSFRWEADQLKLNAALRRIDRLLAQEMPPLVQATAARARDEFVRGISNPEPPWIVVKVNVADGFEAGRYLVVFARVKGGRIPIVVSRRFIGSTRGEFRFDLTNALVMRPSQLLESEVEVVAKLAQTVDVGAAEAVAEVVSVVVDPFANPTVELELTSR